MSHIFYIFARAIIVLLTYKMGQLQKKFESYRLLQRFMEMGVYPYFREITSKQGTEVSMGGHKVLMFGSNAYTGLVGDQRICDAAKQAIDQYGTGCAGSRFLNEVTSILGKRLVCSFGVV